MERYFREDGTEGIEINRRELEELFDGAKIFELCLLGYQYKKIDLRQGKRNWAKVLGEYDIRGERAHKDHYYSRKFPKEGEWIKKDRNGWVERSYGRTSQSDPYEWYQDFDREKYAFIKLPEGISSLKIGGKELSGEFMIRKSDRGYGRLSIMEKDDFLAEKSHRKLNSDGSFSGPEEIISQIFNNPHEFVEKKAKKKTEIEEFIGSLNKESINGLLYFGIKLLFRHKKRKW